MDSAPTRRPFPGYTTAQLEASIAASRGTPAMVAEVAARKAGESKAFVTPQIEAGKPASRIGRL